MGLSRVVHSHRSDEWGTPWAFFNLLDAEFGFDLDPCSTHRNRKCKRHYTVQEDGLAQDWGQAVAFVNPPYSRVEEWVNKARRAARHGATVVMLVISRTDTAWWHDVVMAAAAEVRFVRGRLRFEGAKEAAPFPSVVIVFRPDHRGPPALSCIGRDAREQDSLGAGVWSSSWSLRDRVVLYLTR